jgi:hypothetical protein
MLRNRSLVRNADYPNRRALLPYLRKLFNETRPYALPYSHHIIVWMEIKIDELALRILGQRRLSPLPDRAPDSVTDRIGVGKLRLEEPIRCRDFSAMGKIRFNLCQLDIRDASPDKQIANAIGR